MRRRAFLRSFGGVGSGDNVDEEWGMFLDFKLSVDSRNSWDVYVITERISEKKVIKREMKIERTNISGEFVSRNRWWNRSFSELSKSNDLKRCIDSSS